MTHATRGPTRRSVLAASAGAMAATALGPFAARASAGGAPPARDVLITIQMTGGVDALSFCPPWADPDLAAARPTLNLPAPGEPSGVFDLDGTFGLNAAAASLLPAWLAGRLAIVHAVGTPDPTRSHFSAIRKIALGIPNLPASTASDGWLRRLLAHVAPASSGPVRALAFSDVMPLGLAGASKALPFADLDDLVFPGAAATAAARKAALGAMFGGDATLVGAAGVDSLGAVELFEALDIGSVPPENGALYPTTPFGRALQQTAATIKADVGVEVFALEIGNFDHHSTLGPISGNFARLIRELADGLGALHVDLADHWDHVTVVAHSEFGRRVAENASAGSDHGRAGVMMLMGDAVAGGQIHADWPGLAPAVLEDGDIPVTTDLRDVYGEVLVERLGLDLATLGAVFPAHTFQSPGVIA